MADFFTGGRSQRHFVRGWVRGPLDGKGAEPGEAHLPGRQERRRGRRGGGCCGWREASGEVAEATGRPGWLKGQQEDKQSYRRPLPLPSRARATGFALPVPLRLLGCRGEGTQPSQKESMFSWDETRIQDPRTARLQIWDADHFSADDFLGAGLGPRAARGPLGGRG